MRSLVKPFLYIDTKKHRHYLKCHGSILDGSTSGDRCCRLWVAKTWRNQWCETLSTTTSLSRALSDKRIETTERYDRVILQCDNALPGYNDQKLAGTVKWEVLLQTLYSPDLAFSDYWLFRWIQNKFGSFEVIGDRSTIDRRQKGLSF